MRTRNNLTFPISGMSQYGYSYNHARHEWEMYELSHENGMYAYHSTWSTAREARRETVRANLRKEAAFYAALAEV